jgi:hypothetical protein
MIKATELTFNSPNTFTVRFSDGATKVFDFVRNTSLKGLASELSDYQLFSAGRISSDGRRIEWYKESAVFFDLCVDALRFFWDDALGEWKDIEPQTGLEKRKFLIENKLKSA